LIGFEHDGLPVTAGFTELGITAITFTYVNFKETKCERVNKREEKQQQCVIQDKKHSVVNTQRYKEVCMSIKDIVHQKF